MKKHYKVLDDLYKIFAEISCIFAEKIFFPS